MADLPAAVLAPILETALKHVGVKLKRQFTYLFCLNSNIAGLEGEATQLEATIQGVQNQVDDEVKNNARDIHHEVTFWFKSSDELMTEKNKIIDEVPNVRGGCLKLAARFSLSRRAKKTSEAMTQHREKSKLVEISQPPVPAAVKEIPLPKTFSFDSRKEIEHYIMNALRDKKNVIAIHGMGGLGKTTMAIKIMNTLLNDKVFDEIVIAVVSQKVDELKIQLDIGGSLGLKDLKAETAPQDRVRKLHDRLSAGTRRTLLLLDDVWEELKLENLGIPRGSEGCTILITSRNSDALRQMGVENVFKMDKLSEKDAWLMFSEKAGTCVDDKNLRSIAKEVAKECSGLPIALTVLGASLHNEKSKGVWKDTLNMLKKPNPENTTHYIEKAYMPLIVSYEKLDEKVKSPFLLFCLFREDAIISLEVMTYFCVGLRLFKDLGSLEDARGKISSVVKMLKDRSLLLDGFHENFVRMHDVVRDVCIFIAKQKGFIGGKDCSWISHIQQPGEIESSTALGFPKLRLLFSNDRGFNIDMFFEVRRELYVLYVKEYSWKSLPHTRSLSNLLTLVLERCDGLETISGVGDLVHLQVLICRWCSSIKELPQDMRRLKQLKLLELTWCDKLQSIGQGIISSLVELEELKMLWSFYGWDAIGLSELQKLTKLTCLEIDIDDPSLVAQKINLSSKIERFHIRFDKYGRTLMDIGLRFPIKSIVLCWKKGTCLGNWIEKLIKDAESLYLTGEWITKLDPNYFTNIRNLGLQNVGIRSIETTSMENDVGMFPHMDTLKLFSLPQLEGICEGPISPISFQNLKHLLLHRLLALKQLWKISNTSTTTEMSLPQLKNFRISDCGMIEHMFVWSNEDENITISADAGVGSSNRDVSKITQGVAFPLLNTLHITECPKLRSIVPTPLNRCGDHSSHLFCQPQKVSFGSLKSLEIEYWNPFCHHNNICASFFNGLRELSISKLYDGSASLFVVSVARNLGNLTGLRIEDCVEMVSVIEDDKEELGEAAVSGGGERTIVLFPNLQKLELSGLGKLVTFSNLKNDKEELGEAALSGGGEITIVLFPNLQEILLSGLGKLVAFSNLKNDHVELPFLKEVHINKCPNIYLSLATQTLDTDHTNFFKVPRFSKNEIPSHNLHQITRIFSFVHGLQKLSIERYHGSASIFSSSIAEGLVNLKELRIRDCDKMVKVIEGCEGCSSLLFPKLRILELRKLLELEIFCESDVELPLLEELVIEDCPKIIKFTLGSISSNSFQNLKNLWLSNLLALKQLWKISNTSTTTAMTLPQLQHIRIWYCEQGVAFPLLGRIEIGKCSKMRSLVPSPLNGYGDHSSHLFCQPQKVSFGSLESLDIDWNPFCHHNNICSSFFNQLKKMCISKYDGSMGLFVLSVARNLGNLTKLQLKNCDEMVAVIEDDKEELGEAAVSGGGERTIVLFPNLKELELSGLGKLVAFSNLKNNHVELPLLEKLSISKCPNLSNL